MADKPSVGFVGVGNMGWPMAACLVRAGFRVQVNDSRREVANNFVQQIGGNAPDSLRQLAAESDVVVTMLPTSAIVAHVLAERRRQRAGRHAPRHDRHRNEFRRAIGDAGTGRAGARRWAAI